MVRILALNSKGFRACAVGSLNIVAHFVPLHVTPRPFFLNHWSANHDSGQIQLAACLYK